MPGYGFPRKRGHLSKYARCQRLRRDREKELKEANPGLDTRDAKKEVVKKLCTNSLFFSISKIKNHRSGSLEVKYDEAPYIRLLHQSGLNYVDIEKTLKEEGRYVSRQTISLVARNLKKTLFRSLHIPEPVDIPEVTQKWIEKRFRELASFSDVQNELEQNYGIRASLYQLVSIKKELQQLQTGSPNMNLLSNALTSSRQENNISVPKVTNASECSQKADVVPSQISSFHIPKKDSEDQQSNCIQSKYSNASSLLNAANSGPKNPNPFDSSCATVFNNHEEPLSIICCPDLLHYASNVSPFPLDANNYEPENSNESNSGLNGKPLSIVCCPDLPTENETDQELPNELESSFAPVARRARKVPPDDMHILQSDGTFSLAFLSWAERHSTWEGNFAATLSQYIFTDKERLERNCMGVRRKALDPHKLDEIRRAVFQIYKTPEENKGRTWINCIKAIDSSSRTFRCKNKSFTSNSSA